MTAPSMWAKTMGVHAIVVGGGDCWHPERHTEQHHTHPLTGRAVCAICHPPVTQPPIKMEVTR